MSDSDGVQLRASEFATATFPTPTATLVKRLMETMASIKLFTNLFGPMTAFDFDDQRWSCYARADWSIRDLPAVNIYEGEPEQKTSDNAWLDGSVRIAVYWPPQLRRADYQQFPVLFKGAMQKFFTSKYMYPLLDPHPTVNVETKVPGLNKFGSEISWTPQIEGAVQDTNVPVTILDVKYRIDLRAWYRYLETQDFTKDDPFEATLHDWIRIQGGINGTTDGDAKMAVSDGFDIDNS